MNRSTATTAALDADRSATAEMTGVRGSYWRDYCVLAKPRITLMILLTVGVAMVVALRMLGTSVQPVVWFSTLIGTAMVAASASVLNQWYERDRDSIMPRTQRRPLPSGRLTTLEAALFGWMLLVGGILLLGFGANIQAACISGATWFIYCWIYTPMKTLSWWNTAVGTLPGALPVMIGWTAAGGGLWDYQGWMLTLVVILWQFPHFMSIAWLYREQYQRAGFRMLTGVEPTGMAAAWHAVIPALALIPVSMAIMQPSNLGGWIFAILGAVAAAVQVRASVRFLARRDDVQARILLRSSLVYLPAIFLLAVARWVLL